MAADDSLHTYLAEIARYPLLTRAQELQLAKRIEAGDGSARRRLIESNLRLVVTIAKTYRSGSIELLDLIQEGTLGLTRAADRYDWRRETKFSTYAAWWIRCEIIKALAASAQPIRLPHSVRARIADVQRAERTLTAELGRCPNLDELAAQLDLGIGQILEAQAAAMPVRSLDERASADGDLTYVDLLADPNAADPLTVLVDETPAIDLEQALADLPERSRTVLELRFGLRDGVPRTADAVADQLGLARERIRQIELHTLRKLGAAADPVVRAA